jgi:hypothetical protein
MLFLATLTGAESCLATQDFWFANAKLYKRLVKKESIPSHETFRRILALVRHGLPNGLLLEVLLSSDRAIRRAPKLPTPGKKIISVDGKQLRGTGRQADTSEEIKDLQTLNVYNQNTDRSSQVCILAG